MFVVDAVSFLTLVGASNHVISGHKVANTFRYNGTIPRLHSPSMTSLVELGTLTHRAMRMLGRMRQHVSDEIMCIKHAALPSLAIIGWLGWRRRRDRGVCR